MRASAVNVRSFPQEGIAIFLKFAFHLVIAEIHMPRGIREFRLLLTLAAMLLSVLPARADAELSKAFSACIDKSGGVTSAMLACADAELKVQDDRLNKAYRELSGELNAKRRRELQEVQRLWIRFRDANCRFYEDPEGGTAATIAASSCVLELTATRAKELEDLK
jgi:uncharacterized protein YecT (DUF1311 family)